MSPTTPPPQRKSGSPPPSPPLTASPESTTSQPEESRTKVSEDQCMDDIRGSYARSQFEQQFCALVPGGQSKEVKRLLSYTTSEAEKGPIDNLKKEVREGVDGGLKWKDQKALSGKIDDTTQFDFDLYLEFQDCTTMKFKDLLGKGIADAMVRIAGKPIEDLRATPLKGRQVWMEVCAQPLHARHKLYQLLRAYQCLNPQKPVIGVICLNGESSEAERVADVLEKSEYVKKAAAEINMDVVMVWTENRNIFKWFLDLKKDMKQMRYTIGAILLVICAVLFYLNTKIDTKIDNLEAKMDAKIDNLEAKMVENFAKLMNVLAAKGVM